MKKLAVMTMAALLGLALGLPTYAADTSSSANMLVAAGEAPAMAGDAAGATTEAPKHAKGGKSHKAGKSSAHKVKKSHKKGKKGKKHHRKAK